MSKEGPLEKGELIEYEGVGWMVADVNLSAATIVRLMDGKRVRVAPNSEPGDIDSLELTEAEIERSLRVMSDVAQMPVGKKKARGRKAAAPAKRAAEAKGKAAVNGSGGRICPVTGGTPKGNSVFAGLGTDSRAKSILNKVLGGEMSQKEMTELVSDGPAFVRALKRVKAEKVEKVTKPSQYFA